MKQGTGNSRRGDTKVEPKSQAVEICSVADIGIQQTYTHSKELYEGRGYEAPMNSSSTHRKGSQGRH